MESETTNMSLPLQQLTVIPVNQSITGANDHHSLSISSPPNDTNNEFRFQRWSFYSVIVKSRLYILHCFLAILSSDYLVLGFEMLEKEIHSKSISPVIMTFFKYSFAIAYSHSSTWALIFRSSFKTRYLFLPLPVLATHFLTPFAEKWNVLLYGALDLIWTAHEKDFIKYVEIVLYWMTQFRVFESGSRMDISSDLVIVISIFTAASWTAISDFEHLLTSSSTVNDLSFLEDTIKKLLPLAVPRIINFFETLKKKKMTIMIIKDAIGLVGSVLFQNFFKITKLNHIIAFGYLAYSWLMSLSMISAKDDCGVLNFLLANMIIGSSVNLYELGFVTWLLCGACLCVYIFQNWLKRMPDDSMYKLPERRRENRSALMTLYLDLQPTFSFFYYFFIVKHP